MTNQAFAKVQRNGISSPFDDENLWRLLRKVTSKETRTIAACTEGYVSGACLGINSTYLQA